MASGRIPGIITPCLTVAQVGAILQESPSNVRRRIREYRETAHEPNPRGLRAVRPGRRFLVLPEDLQRYISSLPAVGNEDAPASALAQR
jgi:hypothetical protein